MEARLAHDGEYLYLRLEELLVTERLVNKEDIWSGDDWEIFLAGQRDAPYYQIGIAPDGKVKSYSYEKVREGIKEWQSGVRAVSKVLPDRWTVFLSLPLKSIEESIGRTSRIYINFYRASFSLDETKERELLAWSPNFVSNFHSLTRLGELYLE